MEEWRNIVGYEGYYEVSNFGRVRRIKENVIRACESKKKNGKPRIVYGFIWEYEKQSTA